MKKVYIILLISIAINTNAQSITCISDIYNGSLYTISIRTTEGEIYSWGNNDSGQINSNTSPIVTNPQLVNNENVYSTIEHLPEHTVALTNSGAIYTWGRNNYGQLGNGTSVGQITPQLVTGGNNWLKVVGGTYFTLALKNDGTIWGWGSNHAYQLSGESTQRYTSPIQLSIDSDWKDIFAGAFQTFAIKSDGTLWVRGNGISGVLGTNNTYFHLNFTQVGTDTDWKSIFAPKTTINAVHALKNDSTLWNWGSNTFNNLGNNTTGIQSTPSQLGTDTWRTVSSSSYRTLAIKNDGTLWTWGNSCYLGEEETTIRSLPTQIGTENDWIQVLSMQCNDYALKNNNTLWGWGSDMYGLIGNFSRTGNPVLLIQCPTASTNVNEISDIILYPNPTVENIHWALNLPIENVTVYDTNGNKVLHEIVNKSFMNVSHLPDGMYIIILTDKDNNTYKNKFIKKN